MKVAVVGHRKNYFENAIKKEKNLILTNKNPDIVIAFGGEGTFLYSEMIYPNTPKVLVRHSSKCEKCKKHDYNKIIKALVSKKFKIVKALKIQGSINNRKLVGLNEINIHYKPPCAMRFSIKVNKKLLAKECIGDGLIISTPYGSSGYFFSITKKKFNKGLGIAFNNPINSMKYKIVPENSIITVKIVRGPGVLCVDCNKRVIPLRTGDVIRIQKHSHFARILRLGKEMKVRI